MKRASDLYLKDILSCIERIQEYTFNQNLEDFSGNKMAIDAVLRNLEVIAEAATPLPPVLKDKYPEVPWRDIMDFRIVVAHKYWKINLVRIWDLLENKLDLLEEQMYSILEKEFPEPYA